MLRSPAVAGQFYPADPATLTREIESCLDRSQSARTALGCVVPHAGIMYSGPVAGAVYSRLELPPTAVILGPNHTGRGRPLAILSEGAWETPLGRVEIDSALAQALKDTCPALAEDAEAHRLEHSLEVQLPFLQRLLPTVRIVPIAVGVGRFEPLEELGQALARALRDAAPRPLLVASSDMNHFQPDDISRAKDRHAIDRMLALDARGLFDTVRHHDISMCGYGPAVAVLTAAREWGASQGELVRYTNSGETTGDRSAVVGYAGIILR